VTIHIKQHLIVRGSHKDIRKVMTHVRGLPMTENALLDLNRIVPMPPAVQMTAELVEWELIINRYEQKEWDVYQQQLIDAETVCRTQTGFVGWHDWSIAHWGCKGNAYWIKPVLRVLNELTFHTSTLPAFAAFQTLSAQFTAVVLELEYVDTSRMVIGRALFADGDGCDGSLKWDALEAKALRHRLLGEAEDPNHRNYIIEAQGVH
jgi:hypothetical protein